MPLRRDLLTKRIFPWAQNSLPRMSQTEREALEAGDVWWDGDLFTGNPDWAKFQQMPPAALTGDEQAFLKGPVDELCGMLDDWRINWEWRDLPPDVWAFMKAQRFFGIIIPKQYGGLGFSAFAHSEIVRKIATRSAVGAVTVMVPNSLGPGELLMRFGTPAQRDFWLPRLAGGSEIPCFGLTSPEAGSDAAAMTDTGVVCRGAHEGREVLGLRLNWRKRYITLAPVATVLGLAFKLYDPDHLIGVGEDLGITVALVPTATPGVEIGRRHLPGFQMFQNGPTSGRDVFVPLDNIIGGVERAGQGWKMLMSALAAGRGISLPALSAGGAAFAARATGAYARIREQFNLPIGKFEGVREPLARIAATAYLLDAARRFTCAALDAGRRPAVIAAIMKSQATERLRAVINHAMDVHAGKAAIDGPRNYLASLYRAIPVAITVEGANILTRNLMVFGQGSIRCHPHILAEMNALGQADPGQALDAFDRAFWPHVAHTLRTLLRAWSRGWTGGATAPAPHAGPITHFYKQIGRFSAAFALTADVAFLTLGGALKRKEAISARLGDILSELYLLSAALKRFEDENHQESDRPLLAWCMEDGFKTIEMRFDEVIGNLPNRPAAWLLRFVLFPFGVYSRGPSDALTNACAALVLEPSAARDRLTAGLFLGTGEDGIAQLEQAFDLVIATAPIAQRLKDANAPDAPTGVTRGAITVAEEAALQAARDAVAAVIAVDDFAPEELSRAARKPPAALALATPRAQAAE